MVAHGSEGCNYLLAVDVDMNTVDGYAMSSLGPRLRRLRDGARLRHAAPGAVAARHRDGAGRPAWLDGAGDVLASPRQILRRQLDRLAEHGLTAYAGTELEFVLYRDSYEDA